MKNCFLVLLQTDEQTAVTVCTSPGRKTSLLGANKVSPSHTKYPKKSFNLLFITNTIIIYVLTNKQNVPYLF